MSESEKPYHYVTQEERQENTEVLVGIAQRIMKGEIFDWTKKEAIVHGLHLACIRLGNPNDDRLNKMNLECLSNRTKENIKKRCAEIGISPDVA